MLLWVSLCCSQIGQLDKSAESRVYHWLTADCWGQQLLQLKLPPTPVLLAWSLVEVHRKKKERQWNAEVIRQKERFRQLNQSAVMGKLNYQTPPDTENERERACFRRQKRVEKAANEHTNEVVPRGQRCWWCAGEICRKNKWKWPPFPFPLWQQCSERARRVWEDDVTQHADTRYDQWITHTHTSNRTENNV